MRTPASSYPAYDATTSFPLFLSPLVLPVSSKRRDDRIDSVILSLATPSVLLSLPCLPALFQSHHLTLSTQHPPNNAIIIIIFSLLRPTRRRRALLRRLVYGLRRPVPPVPLAAGKIPGAALRGADVLERVLVRCRARGQVHVEDWGVSREIW